MSRSDLGSADYQLGRTADAIAAMEVALGRAEPSLGARDHDTLPIRNNLADAYVKARRLDEAIALQRRTPGLCERDLGLVHELTLVSGNSLAAAYAAAGRVLGAGALLEPALKRFESTFGPDQPETLTVRNNLAQIDRLAGRTEEAIALHRRTLEQRESRPGPGHPLTVIDRVTLAVIYESIGRWADAEPLRRVNLAVIRASEKSGPRALDDSLALLGSDLLALAWWPEAEGVLRECLAIREKVAPDDWTRFNTMSKLGESLIGQGRYRDAEPLVLGGYEGMRTRSARMSRRGTLRLTEALGRVVRLYESWGYPGQAVRWSETFGRFLDRGFPDDPIAH